MIVSDIFEKCKVKVSFNYYCNRNIMAEKRKRGQNFTLEDKDKLVKLMLQYKDILLNKKTDGVTNDSKSKAWIKLTNAFNSSGTTYRPKESIMKLWDKMKSEGKIYYSSSRRNILQTGGGPSVIKIDPILEQVCSIMGRGCTGIVGVNDSDADWINVDMEPKVNDSQAPEIEVEELVETFVPEDPETDSFAPEDPVVFNNIGQLSECSVKTPLWSRRRPQLTQHNERTEAIASLGASFKEVNQKKEDVEVLKLKLIQMEIEFKEKLYKLQLQAAAAETEIKLQVLSQVKGGSLTLPNLIGAAPVMTDD